jgi:hypothetical protein
VSAGLRFLTIESEERETWTAKSLRGASLYARAGERLWRSRYQVHRVHRRKAMNKDVLGTRQMTHRATDAVVRQVTSQLQFSFNLRV